MPAAPLAPAALLDPLVQGLCFALEAQTQGFVARLARPLMGLVLHRLLTLTRRLGRYLARIEAGRPFPRRRGTIAHPIARRHAPDPLPRRHNWLATLLPEIVPHRAQLALLLQRPEVAAAMATAPAQMGRALRPLCRMLGLPPPPVIAPPPRRKPIRRKPQPSAPRNWPGDPRPRTRLGFYQGPPPWPGGPVRGPPRRRSG